MKRRDFLKLSLSAGVAATLPFNLMAMTSCSDNDNDEPKDRPDISGAADLLVLGNIITIDSTKMFAEAMTIKNGFVQYVGNKETAEALCDKKTQTIDYGKLSIYPGFMEAHCHGCGAGLIASSIQMFKALSYKEYQDILRNYIKDHPTDEQYRFAGWRVLGEPPTKALIDEVCSDKPAFGSSLDGHCCLFNTKAMEVFGIDAEFAKKYPEMVPLGKDGVPTGYITEAAAIEAMNKVKVDPSTAKKYLHSWEEFAFKNGYVAACEAGVNLLNGMHDVYKDMAENNELRLRTRAFYNIVQKDACEEAVEKVAQMKRECTNEYYKIVGVKLFIDGVVESHTALLSKPYTDAPGKHGLNRYDDKQTLHNLVLSAHRHGLSTHTHTIGDEAVTYMLDAIEASKKITNDFSIRDMLAHIQLIKPADVKRFASNNVSAIVASLWCPKGAVTPFEQEIAQLGPERANNNYCVINSFVQKGVNCAQHTDYPVSQDVAVPKSIYCAVTRRLPNTGDETTRQASEAVSRLEVLRELTINVAYLWHEENHMGTLSPGKVANYVVYDCDFIDDDLEKIPNAQLKHVVIDGKEVYHA